MRQIVEVQALRAAAALTVVFGHAQYDAKISAMRVGGDLARNHLLPWGAGVDLFFVISGFIMVLSSERLFGAEGGPATFLARRLVRIAPLWWAMAGIVLLTQVLGVVAGSGKALPAPSDIVASFAFWPVDMYGDGYPRPFFTLGWTLDYEMFFYALFAVFVVLPRERAALGVVLALGLAVGLGAALEPRAVPLRFWSRPIVLEFACGIGLALAFRRGIVLSPLVRACLAGAGVAALGFDGLNSGGQDLDWITPNDFARVLCWGVPMAAILTAAVLGPRPGLADRAARPGPLVAAASTLGDASYALYLSHPFAIAIVRKTWGVSGLAPAFGWWPTVALALPLSCLMALAIHRWAERPVTAWLHARISEPGRLRPVRQAG